MLNIMEEVVRGHPDQWIWLYERWNYIPKNKPELKTGILITWVLIGKSIHRQNLKRKSCPQILANMIIEKIAGSMGEIFKVKSPDGEIFALKAVRKQENSSDDSENEQRFKEKMLYSVKLNTKMSSESH